MTHPTTPNEATMSVAEAHQFLKQFDCLQPGAIAPDRDQIRQALLLLAANSDYQMIGICADSIAQGQQALQSYGQALGYKTNLQPGAIDGAVYIKFNPKTNLCYANPYFGTHRGVLVSCQSAYESSVNDIYGHLPLDLFSAA
jgi:Domain of unknown function (DUF1824)